MEKHREGMQFPGVVFLSDCQALLQILGGQLSATISDSMLKLEGLRTIGTRVLAQWIPSHVGIKGNEDADKLANRGRAAEQPVVPASFADCKAAIRCGLAELWEAAFRDNDDNSISDVRKLALRVRNPKIQSNCCPEDKQSRCSACERNTLCYGEACLERSGRHITPLVACVDMSSNQLPMSCFRARLWRWSEIRL